MKRIFFRSSGIVKTTRIFSHMARSVLSRRQRIGARRNHGVPRSMGEVCKNPRKTLWHVTGFRRSGDSMLTVGHAADAASRAFLVAYDFFALTCFLQCVEAGSCRATRRSCRRPFRSSPRAVALKRCAEILSFLVSSPLPRTFTSSKRPLTRSFARSAFDGDFVAGREDLVRARPTLTGHDRFGKRC